MNEEFDLTKKQFNRIREILEYYKMLIKENTNTYNDHEIRKQYIKDITFLLDHISELYELLGSIKLHHSYLVPDKFVEIEK